ncbi:transglycosylase domain-containing protein [Bacteroides ovatus]|jgi:penicillin-binding protein 1A|uniref:transglycosylase domain-containing protein n=1 Tax=Bacteroides sp. HMSC073E02 TaxID=1739517 RepID=UPI0008A18830|nr:transglycosylase domain-containing protein [Bacteroides sp. HMSC073E02]MCS3254628.1 transglycosylase domain-containing protein [Bacteroides ovatus]OFO87983.1 penicillin-binding protein [Bacteroides sp. HMSC073E02]UVO68870.1 transglycosylase domain-containing protein [Bacteroides ovatus]UVR08596.1 transglycosylase domain-containing protein [Bacteroides ovatus]
MIRKIIKALWIFLAVIVLAIVIVFVSISKGWIGYMPPVEELENPSYKFATEIFSEDEKVLGTWSYSKENRVYTAYKDLSPSIINALIATEDVRFVEHSGIDAKALFRAFVKRGLMFQKNAGGGSTLSQQLAKQLFTENVARNTLQRLFQKPIEWVIAVKLERYYTKEEILSMYLNKFDFLNNAVGIKTAAYTYFGCEPKDLKIEEAATLVGMCKNPSLYNPVRFNERSRGRRNVVLEQMRKAGYITDAECDSLQALPLKLTYNRVDHKEGLATYFREYLRGVMTAPKPVRSDYRGWQMQKFYEDSIAWETNPLYGWCAKNKKKDGTNYNIYTDGLKIYTTINSRMQQYAEDAVKEHLGDYLQPIFFKEKEGSKNAPYARSLPEKRVEELLTKAMKQTERYRLMKEAGASEQQICKAFDTPEEMTVFSWKGDKDTIMTPMDSIRYYKSFLRTGFMSMDPANGHVKAYVGGPNYVYFQYDMAMVGRRQVGSTIKPYLYTLAMENGFSPCDQARHVEQTLIDENGTPWTPRNANDKRYGEMVTLKWGLANSDNWISAYLMGKLNPYDLVRLIHSFGVRNKAIDPVVSLCLGPCEISVGEMVSAYTAFANKGIRVAPLFVTRIEDSDGNVISTFAPQMEEVISASSTYKMLVMLRAVINEGTGGRVRRYGITADMGGKTGTTNDNSDAWFMGFTPSLVSGCWVGGDERDIHFGRMTYGQGAAAALPIWAMYMKKVYDDPTLGYDQQERFKLPEGFDPCAGSETPDGEVIEEGGLDDLFN